MGATLLVEMPSETQQFPPPHRIKPFDPT